MAKALLSRWWLIVIAVAAAAGAAAGVGWIAEKEDSSSTARVGLTSNAVWPLYQADLDSFNSVLLSPESVEPAREKVGASRLDVDSTMVEGLFVLDVIVSSDDGPTAAEAAEVLIESSISEHALLMNSAQVERLDLLQAEVDALTTDIEGLIDEEQSARAEVYDLAQSLDDSFSFEKQTSWREAESELVRPVRDREDLEDRIRRLESEIADLSLELELPDRRLMLISGPSIQSAESPLSGPIAPLLAGVAAAVAVGAWIVGRDRLYGSVRTAAQLEGVIGHPVLADLDEDAQGWIAGERLNQSLAGLGPTASVDIAWAEPPTENALQTLCAVLTEAAHNGSTPAQNLATFDETGAGRGTGVVIVVARGRTQMDEVREQVTLAEIGARRLLGLVIA